MSWSNGRWPLASPKPAFAQVTVKAWGRVSELVVYDPSLAPSAAVLEQGGQQFGVRVSDLHTEFEVTRSQVYADNVAEFRVYNASKTTRAQMEAPGMRVRFSVGYKDTEGAVGIFWGSVMGAYTMKKGQDWVTVLPCVSSLSESTGTEDIATWAEKKENKKATPAQKQEVITRATNRIPISMSYGPDARIKEILRTISTITGLVLWGTEGMPEILLPNGWTYVGGVRGGLQKLDKMLAARGWHLYVENTRIMVVPLEGGNLTVTAAYLTPDTGLLEVRPKNNPNMPPKFNSEGKKVPVRKSYEFKCLINPKIGPNTLCQLKNETLDTVVLVSSAKVRGDNGAGDFSMECIGTVWDGPGDTYRKAS
jgi:hypothetical protein